MGTRDLIGKKITNEITKNLPQNNLETYWQTDEKSIELPNNRQWISNRLLMNYD